jgi:hypothetical protein
VAFWFLESCISACCPIYIRPRIKTTRRSMPSLPWQAKVRAESSRSPPTCRMGEYKFASSPRFGRTNSNRPLLGLEYRCRQGIDGMIDTEGLRGGLSLRPLARRKGAILRSKDQFQRELDFSVRSRR